MPKKPPPTWRDVGEAKRKGASDALTVCIAVLTDKMGFGKEEVAQFVGHVAYLLESIAQGKVNVADLKRAQLRENKISLI